MTVLSVVGQDAMTPVGNNDTSFWLAAQRENVHPLLRKKVGGFYDACLPTGWLIHVVIKSSFAVTMKGLNRYALFNKAAEHMGRIDILLCQRKSN